MERSGNFYKAIRLGYILISILIGCMAYNSLYEWREIEALELGNKKIDELRKEINNINIQMIKFSLLGETILEWNDKDIEHYHARRMAMDSMLCRFKVYAILVSVLWSMAMLCMAFFVPRMPLSEQGIWQRRGLSLGRFLSIFILGFRVLSSFSFRCSWYLVATVSCCGRSLLVHSSGVTFCLSRHLL